MDVVKGDGLLGFGEIRQLEQNGDHRSAARAYEKLLKHSSKKLKILERLLVLYRKLNDVDKEVAHIDAAIKIYQQQYLEKKSTDKKLSTLSRQLNNMLGHTDKKGKSMLMPPEILKLELRKTRLLKKHKPGPKKKK
jgi:tetratricopeptide (TPR) repeat protein